MLTRVLKFLHFMLDLSQEFAEDTQQAEEAEAAEKARADRLEAELAIAEQQLGKLDSFD